GLPGRGLVAVLVGNGFTEGYLMGAGADRIPGRTGRAPFRTAPYLCYPEQFHSLAEVDPAKDAESVTCNLVLEPGRTLTGTIVDSDGKPLAGAIMTGVSRIRYWVHEPLKTPEFTVKGLKPGESQRLLFQHKDRGLAGTILIRGDEKEPLTVKLEPWGVVTGRVLNAEGKPLTDMQVASRDHMITTAEGVKPQPLDA